MTGLILAGGKSKRMGEDKALLKINTKTFVQEILEVFGSIFPEIIIISDNPHIYEGASIKVVPDIIWDKGPLGGLYTGLQLAKYHHCVIAACDMPFINKEVTRYMAELQGYQALVPYIKGRYQPLFAAYSKDCLPAIKARIQGGNLRMIDFIKGIDARILYEQELLPFDPDLRSFININTPQEYGELISQIKG